MADRYVSIGGNQDIIGYDDAEFPYAIETNGELKAGTFAGAVNLMEGCAVLYPLAAAPSFPFEGYIAVADGTTWDPLGLALGRPYFVGYSGGAWRRLDA